MKTSPHLRALLVTALVAQLFGSASAQKAATPVDPRIPKGSYTSEQEAEVLAQFNAMQGLQKDCGDAYTRAYQESLYKYCVATDGGKNIGGGCDHVAYAWSLHTKVLELAFEHCTSTAKGH